MSAYEGKQPPRWTTSWPEWYGIEGNTQVVPASDYDALADRVEAVERDCKQGWDNFYACRKQLAELLYPGMTGTVKAVDAAIKEQADADR